MSLPSILNSEHKHEPHGGARGKVRGALSPRMAVSRATLLKIFIEFYMQNWTGESKAKELNYRHQSLLPPTKYSIQFLYEQITPTLLQQRVQTRNKRRKDASLRTFKSVVLGGLYFFWWGNRILSHSAVWPAQPPRETANILLPHWHRKPSSWPGMECTTTTANPGQGAGVWAHKLEASLSEHLKGIVISDHEPYL